MALAYLCSQPCGLGQDANAAHAPGEGGMQRRGNEAAFFVHSGHLCQKRLMSFVK